MHTNAYHKNLSGGAVSDKEIKTGFDSEQTLKKITGYKDEKHSLPLLTTLTRYFLGDQNACMVET